MGSTSALSLAALLSMFSGFAESQLCFPPPVEVRRVIDRLPRATVTYDSIASELIAEGLRSEEQSDRFERVVSILRVLLYLDGRSETALYRLIDAAILQNEPLAINPLAGLANYYHTGHKSSVQAAILREKLNRYARIELIFNNAMACKRNLGIH